MKIIDTRSGQVVTVGQTIQYPNGESMTLLQVSARLLSARAEIELVVRDFTKAFEQVDRVAGGEPAPAEWIDPEQLPTRTIREWVGLTIRFMHPRYMFQHVGFIPS